MLLETIIPRIPNANQWATIVFIFCFLLVAITRSTFEKRFAEFLRLGISDKYIKVYRDGNYLLSGFTIMLLFVQVLSFTFFFQMVCAHTGTVSKTDWLFFVRLGTLLGSFILIRFFLDKIIGAAFNIDDVVEQFNLQKVSYRTYIALLLLPVNMILFYTDFGGTTFIYLLLILLLILHFVSYFISIKSYQNLIVGKFFYFILYLCALEIAPYYFMYYWFTKN